MVFSEIDGEVVMLSIENSEYYGLDDIGTSIWNLLENELTVSELVAILLNEYEVIESQCRKDVLQFLEKLAEKNLITVT